MTQEARRRKQAVTPSPDSDLVLLTGKEAAERLLDDPTEVFLPVTEFCRWARLTLEECQREAAAGRISLQGIPRGGGDYSDLCVTAHDAAMWIARYRMLD